MIKGSFSLFLINIMNITLPRTVTPLASTLKSFMIETHGAESLNEPVIFDVSSIEVLKTISQLLNEAQLKSYKVFVAGDYDADGICSTTMMVSLCKSLELNVGYYIPHRMNEGYGLKPDIAKQAIEKGYDLFICVDNGVSAHEAIHLLKTHHKKVIIIDHHIMSEEVHVDALLHPLYLDPVYDSMCTSGLVWLLASHLNLDSDFMIQLAGCATLADMMPLHSVNRHIVVKAIESMNQVMITPLALLIKKQSVNEEDLNFQLIPKINAIGRMSDVANANTMVAYLGSTDITSMVKYASMVEDVNEQRKALTKSMSLEALSLIEQSQPFHFVVSDSFHEGIVGLIANQLLRSQKSNVFVGVKKENTIKGSMRSYNVHLVNLFKPYEHLLMHFGGHAKAAGLEVHQDNFETLQKHILEDLKHYDFSLDLSPSLVLDPSLITLEGVVEFESLRPFGMGWERPIVRIERVRVKSMMILKGGMSKATVQTSHQTLEIFSFDPSFAQCVVGDWLDVEGTLGINTYMGSKSIQLTLTTFNSCVEA
jgi:single-stranded-DNA-specific exonuclease